MTPAERKALAKALFGTADEPGPIDVGWAKKHLGVGTGTTLARWRSEGIPNDKVPRVLGRLTAALPTQKMTPLPDWAEGLAHMAADEAMGRLIPPELAEQIPELFARIRAFLQQADEAARAELESQDPAE